MPRHPRKLKSKRFFESALVQSWLMRPLLSLGLLVTIPAFYLVILAANPASLLFGRVLYIGAAFLIMFDFAIEWRQKRELEFRAQKLIVDVIIACGCLLSVMPFPEELQWIDWAGRLILCAIILMRIFSIILMQIRPGQVIQIFLIATIVLLAAGAGFYWLEPHAKNYADGLWLAFTTVATVGYGDIVPSTPASKVFAFFIVLLGYALFSVVTANIAALFMEEEEEILERELHADIRKLTKEVAALREELRELKNTNESVDSLH